MRPPAAASLHLGIILILAGTFRPLASEARTFLVDGVQIPTLQAGIDSAASGDTVLVAAGTYVENINFMGKAIAVKSESGPSVTVIDGNGANSVVTFATSEGASSELTGFTT